MSKDNAWARENGLADKFCFMFCGTLGMKHRPELLLQLARHLDATREAVLIVNAAGAGAAWLREQTKDLDPEAFRLQPFQPYERLSEVMAFADVLIALLDFQCGKFSVPSKTLAYLCAARPILMAAPNVNQAVKVIRNAKAGLVVSRMSERFRSCGTRAHGPAESESRACAMRARLCREAFQHWIHCRSLPQPDRPESVTQSVQ